ncbi:MAG: DNA repair protein RecO C-terminal domain-containing protein [Reinekea sp.]
MKNKAAALPVTGVILHRRPYKESDHFCTLLTAERGRLDCVYQHGVPEFYREFQTKLSSKGGLLGTRDFRYLQPTRLTDSSRYAYGLYLNELLYWLAPSQVSVNQLYGSYLTALVKLEYGDQISQTLRFFEAQLLQEIGLMVDFYRDVQQHPVVARKRYGFTPGEGFESDSKGRYSGEQVLAAGALESDVSGALSLARECLAAQLDLALNYRTIQSRLWLKNQFQIKKSR